ncbi:ANTAR domain-containing protein [Amycolatopsis thailandensis]|uniref:ANTAR domain-containing protein n=1 Tax=Amycolatopsis thailandensis TaxID=589330 RepID=UPI003629BD24
MFLYAENAVVRRPEPTDLQAVIDHLNIALASQPVIEQAKGMIMLLRNWDADQAFAALRQVSQLANVRLHDVAAVIVAAGTSTTAFVVGERVAQLVLREVRLRILGSSFGE